MRKKFLFIVVFVLLVCLAASPALAQEYTYTLTVPSPIAIPATGKLNRTLDNNSAAQTVSCTTTNPDKTTATVVVRDATATDPGKLKKDGSGAALSSALKLSGEGFTTVNTLSASDQPLVVEAQGALSGTPKSWTKTNALVITQPAFTPAVEGTYSTIITFTATFTP